MAEDLRWWHGGVPGLRPGDLLLPPAETGASTRVDLMTAARVIPPGWMNGDRNRRDRVYLTSKRELARAFAWGQGQRTGDRRGALYIARPIGQYSPDPDMVEHSIECERAEVITVYDPHVHMTESRFLNLMLAENPTNAARQRTRRRLERMQPR